MDLTIIVAMTKERVIGIKNKIPWNIKKDLHSFKSLTSNNTIIMGRNTFESILSSLGKPLPERNNIVVSKTLQPREGIYLTRSLDEAIKQGYSFGKDIYFIGGASIYKEALNKANKLFISWIKEPYKGDTFFPEYNENNWEKGEMRSYPDFNFIKYYRKK